MTPEDKAKPLVEENYRISELYSLCYNNSLVAKHHAC